MLGLHGNKLRSIPSALLVGPTSKLLAHLASKIPANATTTTPPAAAAPAAALAAFAPAAAGASVAAQLQQGGASLSLAGQNLVEVPDEVRGCGTPPPSVALPALLRAPCPGPALPRPGTPLCL